MIFFLTYVFALIWFNEVDDSTIVNQDCKKNPMRKHLQSSPSLINILEKNYQLLVIGFNKLI